MGRGEVCGNHCGSGCERCVGCCSGLVLGVGYVMRWRGEPAVLSGCCSRVCERVVGAALCGECGGAVER